MNKMLVVVASAILAGLIGCATAPLTPQEQAVRLLRKSDAPASCRELSRVTSPGLAALSDEGRENNLKRATSKVGGDTVVVYKTDDNGTLYGMAFKCP